MIIRLVFSSAVLVLAGVLVVALSGHLWSRYQVQTAAIGFEGVADRLAAEAGLTGDPRAYGAIAEGEGAALPAVRGGPGVEE
jgi:hypothetical protein